MGIVRHTRCQKITYCYITAVGHCQTYPLSEDHLLLHHGFMVIVRHTRCQKITYCYIMKVAILAVTALALVQCAVALTREYPVVRAQKYCYDQSPGCEEYAKAGECDSNPDFMHAHCKVTCDLCEKGSLLKPVAEVRAQKYCYDQSPGCEEYAKAGECDSNPDFMHAHCKVTCDLCEKG